MTYYPFILAAFAPFGIIVFKVLFEYAKPLLSYSIVSLFSIFIIYTASAGTYIFSSVENTAHYQFDKIIQQEPNPTLLNYGFLDGGFYTYSGIVPSNRYFCYFNIPIPEMKLEQDSIINNHAVKFIVTRHFNPNNVHSGINGYTKVAEIQSPFEKSDEIVVYTLHKRNQNYDISE